MGWHRRHRASQIQHLVLTDNAGLKVTLNEATHFPFHTVMLVLTVLALATALAPASAATVTSLLNPTPLTSGAGAASTQLAGESPLTRTRVNFPTMLDWWVVGAPNQVEWDFVEPDADASDVSLHVVLDNLDKTLCPQPVRVNGDEVVRAHWSGWGNANTLKG